MHLRWSYSHIQRYKIYERVEQRPSIIQNQKLIYSHPFILQMIEVVLSIVALVALIIASYTDITTREVPDWLSYGLLFSALGIRFIFASQLGFNIFWSGLLGFFALFFVGYLFYLVSQWGGGDAKLLMGMGAIIGVSLPFRVESLGILWYFIALLFLGAIYGLAWMVFVAIKGKKRVFPSIKETLIEYKYLHLNIIFITLLFVVITLFNKLFWPLILFPPLVFYSFVLISVVEKTEFHRRVHPINLTQGDWLVEDVKINSKTVLEKKTLDKEDIIRLRSLATNKQIIDVLIKDGIPFIPSFLFAYIVVLSIGNIGAIVLESFA
jgi:Flp pilus assembly protein protease CpaA